MVGWESGEQGEGKTTSLYTTCDVLEAEQDSETARRRDSQTARQRDRETERHGDTETRRHGDAKTEPVPETMAATLSSPRRCV
jgi:hypothetical protein